MRLLALILLASIGFFASSIGDERLHSGVDPPRPREGDVRRQPEGRAPPSGARVA